MASFDVTANVNARLNTSQVSAIAKRLKRQLTVSTTVNLSLTSVTQRNVSVLTTSLRNLNTELATTRIRAGEAGRALHSLASAFAQVNRAIQQSRDTTQRVNRVADSTRNAATQMQNFGRQAGLAFRRFAGFRIASGGVLLFTNAVTQGISEAISFQRELVRISQVSGRSLSSLSTLTDEITRLATSLGVSSASLVDISRILTQAGFSANETQQALEALAKSSLAPTFTDIQKTAEGAIAIFRQFDIQANELETALSSINAVSGKFAVESDDIIAAVKRAGGVFAATSEGVSKGVNALNEFIAIFTSVRATTRESADSIATGLRTVFTRIQRPRTIEFLKELGVNLRDLQGQFIGPFKAINRLSEAFKNLDNRDPQFAKLVEELGGFRQVSRVIPLLTEQETRLKALQVAQEGSNSLAQDAETAQEALAVQLTRVREEFTALIREFTSSDTFNNLVTTTLSLARAFITLADSLQPVLPLLGAFATIQGANLGIQFTRGLFSRGALRFNKGGEVPRRKFGVGGIVPGGRGVRDDFDTTLPSGAFVIRRQAVDIIGRENLEKLNKRKSFNRGGEVPVSLTRGEFIIDPEAAKTLGRDVLNLLNNADKLQRQNGGPVDRVELLDGGFPGSSFGTFTSQRILTQERLDEILKEIERDQARSAARPRPSNNTSKLINQINRRGINRAPRRAAIQFGGRKAAQRLGRIGLTTGTLGLVAGSQIGGTTGDTISGASLGGLLASSAGTGPIGIAAGTVIGGVTAALNSLVQSRLDRKIKETSESLSSSLQSVEKALRDLEDGGSIDNLVKSLQGTSGLLKDLNDIDKIKSQGIFQNISETLAESFEGVESISPQEDRKIGARRQQIATTLTGAFAGSLAGPIGTLVGGLAGILTQNPDEFRTPEEVQAEVSDRRRENRQRGRSRQSELSVQTEAAQRVLAQQVKEGKNIEEIFSSLSDDSVVALALGFADTAALESIGEGENEVKRAKAQLKAILPLQIKQIQEQQRLATAISSANIELDRFGDNLEIVKAKINRASEAGSNFEDINNALINGGIQRLRIDNPFSNPLAFSQDELSTSARDIVSGLGRNNIQGLSREVVDIIDSFTLLRERLPNTIINAANRAEGDPAAAIVNDIGRNFGNVPSTILDVLTTRIEAATKTQDPREISGNIQKLLLEVFSPVFDTLNDGGVLLDQATDRYLASIRQWVDLQRQANELADDTIARTIQNRNNITTQDRNLSFGELIRGFAVQQNIDANRAGADNSGLGAILRRLSELDSQRQNLQNRAATFNASGAGDPRAILDSFAQLTLQEKAAETVLQRIATNTQITAAATQRLQEIENQKRTSQQLAEEFVSSDPAQRRQFERELNLAQAARAGAQFSGESAQAAFRGERRLTGLEGLDPREADRRIRENLAQRSDVDRLFNRGGRNAFEALIQSPEERRLRGTLEQNLNVQRQAGGALAFRQQEQADGFLQRSNQAFEAIAQSLGQTFENFTEQLSSLPTNIEIGGTVNLGINITGGEALTSLRRDFGDLIDNKIREALKQQTNPTERLENFSNV